MASPKRAPTAPKKTTAQQRAAYNKAAGAREDARNRANPAAPGQLKKAAGVRSARAFTPAATKAPTKTVIDQIGDFFRDRADRLTGKKPTPISNSMKNPTPVIPYTVRNVRGIQKANK